MRRQASALTVCVCDATAPAGVGARRMRNASAAVVGAAPMTVSARASAVAAVGAVGRWAEGERRRGYGVSSVQYVAILRLPADT